MMRLITGADALQELVGEHLGYSDWHMVDQDQINLFADATGDHQWIHVDEKRAADGPFGSTVAHGYLTMSMAPMLAPQVYRVAGAKLALNYGLDRVRFPRPVPVGSSVRLGVELLDAAPVGLDATWTQMRVRFTFELDDGGKPVCVAEALFRYAW